MQVFHDAWEWLRDTDPERVWICLDLVLRFGHHSFVDEECYFVSFYQAHRAWTWDGYTIMIQQQFFKKKLHNTLNFFLSFLICHILPWVWKTENQNFNFVTVYFKLFDCDLQLEKVFYVRFQYANTLSP